MDFEKWIQSIDPAKRLWEYDGDGKKIYKIEAGFTGKTEWDGGYALWKKRFGHDWEPLPKKDTQGYDPKAEPYYVDLPQEKSMIQKWVNARMQERTSLDGAVLIICGIAFLIFKPIASAVAYAAIAYGAWNIWKKG